MSFIAQLKHNIKHHLPGEKAHKRLSPLHRPITSEVIKNLTEYKESAVSIILFKAEQEQEYKCILIQRSEYDGKHSGQISFPGGKKDAIDIDLQHTAIRECFEEIGVVLSLNFCLGKLSPVYIPVSGFLVEPFVFIYPRIPKFNIDVREVASVFTITLNELLAEDVISEMKITSENKLVKLNVPCFQIKKNKIWGATALILNELRELIQETELNKLA
jgi:8-oxo-dGTP pyrophosphatase MutT (NUDIX family)